VKITDFNVSRKFGESQFAMRTKTGIDAWNAPEMLQGIAYN
jgi:hypothetical protein